MLKKYNCTGMRNEIELKKYNCTGMRNEIELSSSFDRLRHLTINVQIKVSEIKLLLKIR